MAQVKFICWTDGDSSVGIGGENAEVTIGVDDSSPIDFKEEIATIKVELETCFGHIWGETPHVMTEDEIAASDPS
jgi:hypothetical protein